MELPYQRVSCSLYDSLEAWATRQQVLNIQVRATTTSPPQNFQAKIVDLNTRKGAEYMLLDNGEEIRLDYIESIQPVAT
ncbi:MAG: hypothetical protein AAFP19_12935 [Bacteroidota bacterium]